MWSRLSLLSDRGAIWMELSYLYFVGWGLGVSPHGLPAYLGAPATICHRIPRAFKLNAVVSLTLLLFTTLTVVL